MPRKQKPIAEFGDFQTPDALAEQAIEIVRNAGIDPATIIEPSCGVGSFLHAAANVFPNAYLHALEINESYVAKARERLSAHHARLTLSHDNFFAHDWTQRLAAMNGPILIVGNPPWVTNSELGLLGSQNVPLKTNFQKLRGMDALTGKSNFDISEWMILQKMSWLVEKTGLLAVLCKTSVARKILTFAWKNKIEIANAKIYQIDAANHFNAAVDACLFVLQVDGVNATSECSVYENLEARDPSRTFGFIDQTLVRDINSYRRLRNLRAHSVGPRVWRSGLKHDCSRVMELERAGGRLVNGYGEQLDLEESYIFPLLKSSDVANGKGHVRQKCVIVPQRVVGGETQEIKHHAPRTWEYLDRHRSLLDARTSSIYRGKPAFSVFGIGPYSFAPWKIAISAMYKKLAFSLFGPVNDKPVFFDDTVNFLSFDNEEEARLVFDLLNTELAQEFFGSIVFWDEKRPLTTELLRRLDIDELARSVGRPLTHRASATNYPGQLPLAG